MIYMFGYSKRSIADIQRIIGPEGLLLDIRLSPKSRRAGFSEKRLSETFGDQYTWLYEFGNENYGGGDVKLYDPEIGLEIMAEIVKEHTGPIFLMCLCRDGDTCHRRVVGELLRNHGYEAKEYTE